MTPQDYKQISKKLSLLLRHKPELYHLELDPQGWCEVETLLAAFRKNGQPLDRSTLEAVVAQNDKQRFAFSTDGTRIRANQGHSIAVQLEYAPQEPPAVLFHGTATRFLSSIYEQGLLKQQRHHVHLSPDIETASKVGARHGKLALLKVDSARMFADGYSFFCSENGVWLTEQVPPAYIQPA
ncbi:MAG: RNA 2'-phosphotransferase [Phaeodactylibacter sp.]|uniref:RNA 2'-phosphotransferase n=1 Tax=Phaeodactylibacter sp. TaxID=1940289 RepID=UPI0032EE9EF3